MNPNEIELIYELSPMQQAMLFHSLLAPASGVYVIQMSLRLTGWLNVAAFERAWRRVIERHGILRTAFFWEGLEKPLQVVYRQAELPLRRESWRGIDPGEQKERLDRLLDTERERGFELAEAPLLRLSLFELGDGVHQMVWTIHHLLVDGWSQGQLLRELFTCYAAYAKGEEPKLAAAKSFREYIAWLQRQDAGKAEDFWRRSLAGFDSPTLLAGADGGAAGSTWRASRRRDLALAAGTTTALREAARRHRLTLNTLVQGAWSLLLAQASGREDVVFGTTVSGRPADLPGIEATLGLFINSQPVRVEVRPERRLWEWLAALQERQVEMRRFEHSSLVDVQRWSALPPGVPLFDHLLVFENVGLPAGLERPLPGLEIAEDAAQELTNYPLNVVVIPGVTALLLTLRYDAARFDGPEAARLLERLARLLTAFAEDRDPALGDLPRLLPAERHQVLLEWNDTARSLETGATLHALIARQVERTPEAVAASFEGEDLTYRELERRAGALAGHLVRMGVRPDGRVGVLLERSLEMIVALLGTLEAGAAYVPLDPTWPAGRLATLIESSGARVVLAQERWKGLLPGRGEKALLLDARDPFPVPTVETPRGASPAAASDTSGGGDAPRGVSTVESTGGGMQNGVSGTHLAYVLYTSGSTGTPKGVMIPHRGIVNRLLWMQEAYGLAPEDRVLQKTPFSFDVSLWEFFWPLLIGARLVFARPEGHKDPCYLVELIAREQITTLHFVPSMLQAFLEAPDLESLTSIRKVMASGEALPPELVRRFFARLPHAELHNLYGPTEASVDVSFWAASATAEIVPIGRPIANLRLHVMDRDLRPVPIGVAGELLLGGVGLARGYLGRPDLTAASFVPDPGGAEPGGRLYRTGDLTRFLPDGNVEYLGRIDHQVKIRGFRIELGEIEAVLSSHPAVRECVVLARRDDAHTPGDARLVAYVLIHPGSNLGDPKSFFSEHLRKRLPEHMIPAFFVLLDAFPLTTSGKVDRKALPAPERPGTDATAYVAPSDPLEELLAGVWSEVLGVERVGANDHFFSLGGHSLLATRVVSRIRAVLGVDLPLRTLFEAPVLAGLARAVRESQARAPAPPIVRVPRDGALLLSFGQQRLWLIDQLDPGNPAFNIPLAVRLTGEVEPEVLLRIFREIFRRHEVLRTTFEARDGQPVPVIAPALEPELHLADLSGLLDRTDRTDRSDPASREALRLVREEARLPFDLRRGPLLRLSLVRLGAREHLLLLTMHHVVSDGWSLGVLLREIAALYPAFSLGLPSPLPELPVQYADFAAWQRTWLRDEVLAEQLGWWRLELEGSPAALDLPTDRPRSVLQSRAGALLPVALPAGLTEGVRELARQEGATPFLVLLAAFQTLLHRLCGQDDIPVGTPVANRNGVEIEGLIGYFVNTLVLRGRFADAAQTFPGLLEQTRETVLAAFEHKDAPFERLVDELAQERNLALSPLFQVLFSLQTAPAAPVALPRLTLEPLPVDIGLAKLDLSLYLTEAGGAIHGTLEISRSLFDTVTAERLAASFLHLLRGAVDAPEARLADLPLLDEAQRHQVLREWSMDGALPAGCISIVPLFERRAALTPDAPALSHQGRRFTYRELDRWANRLARRLRGRGVRRETPVAVLAERSPELIAAFLGILKAGGVYVPLDPAYPTERLAFMRDDARAAVLLTPEEVADAASGDGPDDRDDRDDREQGRNGHAPAADQLAYVLYTSGSTGRPKGVMVSHGALARYTEAVRGIYAIGPADRVLQFCSTSFDTSLEETVPCLTGGAELVLRTDAMLASPAVFLDSCREQGVTALSLPTAYWHEVAAKVETEGLALPPGLRLVILGGERALLERVEGWRRTAPGPRLVNTYGVTESTIVSTSVDLAARSGAEARGEVSIGRAIGGTDLHLLDREGAPVPIGALGELYIGGGLLARGYLGRPDLTAERFLPHPFPAEPGARLYRTGDVARALPDGALELAGRADRQIKIRGYRIEIAEIEARLLQHPDIESAVVTVREDRPGEKRIAAYVVPRSAGPGPAPADLRTFLRETLPDYMVPGAWVTLAALPLTPNGKLDRRALPAPEGGDALLDEGYAAPSDPVEELLAGIWAEVLGRDRVGVHDDFFALGGHSLLATQVVSRIRGALGAEVPLRQLFEAPTVAELARAVQAARPEVLEEPIVRAPREESPLPLSFAQQRLWVIDQLDPGSPAYNIYAAVRLTGALAPALLERVFAEIVRRHEALRTTFAARDGRPVQVVAPPSPLELPLFDLSGLRDRTDRKALRLAHEEVLRPFDLQRGPLLRLALVRLGAREHLLLLTMHHIVSDGWSMGVLLREIAALHDAFSRGLPSPLPELRVQYGDFAVWQRRRLQGEVLDAQLAFWKRRLAGAPQVLELPTDRPRPAVQSPRGATRPVAFSPALSESVLGLCRRRGVTPFMALLAAWSVLLGRLADQDDLLIGTPIAGRNRREIEPLIGFFVNTLALRVELKESPDFGEVLDRVRAATLEAFAHQDLPFERLVEELVPERDLSRPPLFQVMFVLQNAFGEVREIPGLALRTVTLPGATSRFDLSLALAETPEGLAGALEHSTDLFDATTIERLIARLGTVLEGAVQDPGRPIAHLPWLLPGERQQVLVEGNDTRTFYPREAGIPEVFAAVVAAAPEAPAVVEESGEVWTYRRLAEAASHLAGHLRELGIAPGDRVGVAMERSADLIVAFLAILEAGAAYVPLDPGYPDERLAFLVEDAGVGVVLVHEQTRNRMEALEGRLRRDPHPLTPSPTRTPYRPREGGPDILWLKPPLPGGRECVWERGLGVRVLDGSETAGFGDNLAYVLYTSGSTGTPKGVAVPHRAILRLVFGTDALRLRPDDRLAFNANTSFDAATWEIWATLLSGAALVVISQDLLLESRELAFALRREQVTVLHLTTALFNRLVQERPEVLSTPSLRCALFGGEASDPAAVLRALGGHVPERLLHMYGPTESTTFATYQEVHALATGSATVPIGRLLGATRGYVLERSGEPAALGQPGELHLGGDGLAWGYLGRPELTAAAFVPDPWSAEPGGRLYRTGDLVRSRPDGALEFQGRIDNQVKIRGFRIEPGEVEALLARHPAVTACAVLARRDGGGDARLVAYVVLDRTDRSDLADLFDPGAALAAWLRERLPDHLVPSVTLFLDTLPLTPNGKVDRRALPAPAAPEAARGVGYVAPSDPAEESLAAIWAEVLGLDRVGVWDNFFALGGHSLLATQVMSRLRDRLGVALPLRRLFELPTVAELAGAVRAARGEEALPAPPLVPLPREGALPLSFAQQRLWFLDQLEPDSPAYNMPLAVRLTGDLSPDLLGRIFTEIVRRHEALRTTFALHEGTPVQVIAPPRESPPALHLVDLSGLRDRSDSSDSDAPEALRLARAEALQPFDLRQGPLLRLTLVRLGAREHLLLLTLHHIVADGWSLGVLLGEIAALHEAFSRGLPSPLPELPVQVPDFALWQRSWMQGPILEAQLAAWRRRLAGAPQVLELPADRPRPVVQTFRGATRPVAFSPSLAEAVSGLCRREGVTPFMALLAAWSVLLGRLAGQDDLLIGTPIAGRNRREIEPLIGFFVNTLALRVRIGAEQGFAGLLGRVRETTLDAFADQDLPFERLVEELVPQRDLARSPLFQVMFALQNTLGEPLEVPGLTLRPLALPGAISKFDLSLVVAETDGGLAGFLEHNTDLFDGSTAERLIARFLTLLEGAVAEPGRPVGDLPLLLPAELHQVLVEANDTRTAYPREASLPELFAVVAETAPEAPAMIDASGEVWSYARLAEAASRLAGYLRELGIAPGDRVGVAMERSADLIVAFLAILGAGAAYVPLDPGYPDERLAFLVADAEVGVVLVHERTRGRMEALESRLRRDPHPLAPSPTRTPLRPGEGGVDILWLKPPLPGGRECVWERGWGVRALEGSETARGGENLAYVLYTSGSTGTPKGVAIPHRAILRLIFGTDALRLRPDDRLAFNANTSFDAATWEIWATLLAGAALVVIPQDLLLAPRELAAVLRRERVTVLHLTTALFNRVVAETPEVLSTPSLRCALFGGEASDPAAVARALAGEIPEQLLHMYGPTESTTFATYQDVHGLASGTVPIGRPLGTTQAYVLDRSGAPAGLGQPGELLLGGDGLAWGYLHRPELTAEAFVPDPWSAEPGGRLYRTGDLVRRRADGALEFQGRIDSQVKIRGYRIEPGEVEALLARHPRVAACAVLARRDGGGDARLVAYAVLDSSDPIDPGPDLAAWLRERLPAHLVPSATVFLDALPLTPNGKVDRRALPAPPSADAAPGTEYVAPSGPVEETLAAVWAEVLGLGRVGARDDFFTLGGHSLLATQVMSRLREALGVELPLRTLFERPTVAGLADAVQVARAEAGTLAPPLVPVPREGDLPLSFAQQRLWLLDRLQPDSPAYNMPLAVRLTGDLAVDVLERVFVEIVRRHEALRTTFDLHEGRPVQVVAEAQAPALPRVDLSSLRDRAAQEALRLARAEAGRPFDLQRGPLLRLTLVRLGAREHLLLLTLHHIVADGWSLGVLLREIAALHEAFSRSLPSPLPELPVQVPDFALWQREWLQGPVLEAQLAAWTRRLADAPQVLELPTDRPRPPVQTFRGAARPVAFAPALSAAVLALCRRERATPFMTLLAAWSALLGRLAGQDDLLIGTPIAGRNRREIEPLIGFFVNTLALRVELKEGLGFAALLGQVRETTLDAFAHQDLPFERLVEELVPQRDLSRSPVFQVMFSLQSAAGGTLEVPGLTLQPLSLPAGTAKFDLELAIAESPQGLAGALEHNTDLFDATTAERLAARLQVLLEGAVQDPGQPLAALPWLLPAERHQLLVEGNDTRTAWPREASLPELFAAVAEAAPEAPAVIDASGEVWSYRRLAEAANHLAAHLGELGIAPGDRVGVAMERSADLIVAFLAILEAGAAYVPLDPGYPDERLAFLVEDAGVGVVLVHERTRGRMDALESRLRRDPHPLAPSPTRTPLRPGEGGVDILWLKPPLPGGRECVWERGLGVRVLESWETARGGENLAYVLYTSGSTGTPKGVAVPHRAILRLVFGTAALRLRPDDRLAFNANTSFDAATWEIWATLLAGAALVVIPQDLLLSPRELAVVLRRERVTVLHLTTALFNRVVAETPEVLSTPSLRCALFGGEASDPSAVARALAGEVPERLFHMYGPTESTTFATYQEVHGLDSGAVPVGRPLGATQAWVLDRTGELAALGQPGELFLGGDGLAWGYLHRPELTAEAFVPDPWSAEPGGRLYRTGDLVRRLADGALEFRGRIDSQVKIRGYRIEPGEVEALLARHPRVAACAVLARRDGGGDARLVAYAVLDRTDPSDPTDPFDSQPDLAAWLRERLPDHLVPSATVILDALPLTPNGKVDRRALPAPPSADAALSPGYVAPSGPVEETLAAIWAEVLGLGRVGARDDFFALGGHSLLATQVMSRLRDALGVELPLRTLFERSTVAELAEAVRTARGEEGVLAPPLVPVPREGALPLSFAQQRLWFLDQLEPDSPAYNIPFAVRLTGELSVAALEATFAEVVRRHEALRTTFAVQEGRPVQAVADPESVRLALPVLDLAEAPEEAREDWERQLLLEEARQPFDLARGPLLRLALLRRSAEEHLLLVTLHHIVSDAWSIGVLVREIAALYPAFVQGEPSSLSPLPVQYPDFAVWQRSWLQGEALDRQLGYWRDRLAGAPQVLELPTDHPRPAVPAYRGGAVELALPPALSAALRELCRQEGATPFMLLLAAWAALLGRQAGQEDVLVGTPIAGRNRREIEGLIGFFVNTLVLRVQPGANGPGFAGLLRQVRAAALDAYAHQDLPFEQVVDALVRERDLSHSPLFQVLFAWQNAPGQEGLRLPGLTLAQLPVDSGVAKFDLSLTLWEGPEGFLGSLGYSTDLFDRTTVARFVVHFERLLAAVAADPHRPVAELPLLPPAEAHQLLVDWNDTRMAYPRDASLPEAFAAVAEAAPEAPAVIDASGETWSYRRLAAAAGHLAAHLRALGIEPGDRVGVAMERSAELVASLLAILEAGAAYVPLDPGYPDERLAFLVEDAGVGVVLVHGRTRGRMEALEGRLRRDPHPLTPSPTRTHTRPGEGGLALAFVDADAHLAPPEGVLARSPGFQPGVGTAWAGAESLAYLIYTSGSTGTPKGVAVPHRAILRLALGEVLRLRPDDRLAFNANTSFDAATYEIWTTLLAGAALVVVPQDVLLAPRELAALLRRERVTVMFLTTAVFNRVAQEAPEVLATPSLRSALFGGEAADPVAIARALTGKVPAQLLNMYGPTECTTFALHQEVHGLAAGALTVPIGRPLGETRLHVLDRAGEPAALGQLGELLLGGDGLAWGYLGRPDLTAAVFVPDPWSREPGDRLYRTGDLVRYRADGTMDYLGRIDHQVKIRGFRIEPGEVEAVLGRHPGVAACAVLAWRDGGGEARLVAYVVLHPSDPTDPSDSADSKADLAAWLRERLPDHLVPSATVFLDALPLTPNGKVDRRALPAPQAQDRAGSTGYAAPSDATEEALAGIWAEVLGLDRVGVHDNFFALGGHSLLATQVISRLREALGVDLPLRKLFERPTVAELAGAVREARGGEGLVAPPIVPVPREGALPLSFAQQRLWFLDQLEPESPAYNIPMAVRLTGELSIEALERTFTEVVRRHEALRTVFARGAEQPVQIVADPASVRLELPVLDLSGAPEEAVEGWECGLALEEAAQPFDLARGPLLRLALLRRSAQEHLLLATLHHIVSDGWSMGVLMHEIAVLYAAFVQGEPSPLPPLPVQYPDFALWQRSWLRGDVLARQLGYWRHQLAGAPSVLELPTDRPRPAVQTFNGGTVGLALPPALSAALQGLCQAEGATPFMLLLAAWALLLGRHTGQDDVLVGTPIAGRNRREVEALIGFFINTLVIRVPLRPPSGAPGFLTLLRQVRATALDAYAHQDLPFEQVVEALVQERDLSRAPLVQSLFTMQNAPASPGGLQLPGLTLRVLSVDSGVEKLDLSLTFGEGADGFVGSLGYNTDLFDRTTALRFAARFERLLAAAAGAPDRAVADLPLLLPAESQQLLVEWTDAPPVLSGPCLHDLFAAQVERAPEAVAVIEDAARGGRRLTYAELAGRAGALARRLRTLGAGPEVRVAVCLERSADLIAALLGVLASGAAYVPIDPAYPLERRAFLLEDSGAAVLVTRGGLATDLPAQSAACRVFDLDVESLGPDGWWSAAPGAGGLAYVIYTSGSTGRPKGVGIEHRSVVARAGWARETFSAEELSGVLAATSVCFDLSVFEIFAPLAWGGTVILAENALELPALAAASEVRLLNTVPSAAAELVRAGSLPASVRTVCLAGEPLPAVLAARLYATGTVERVLNLYGPSEDTTYSTGALVPREVPGDEGRAPAIGRPLPGTRAVVVDAAGRPVPLGVAGELWLSGAGLARGYLGRPELTAERFIPVPGGRAYRTGDLVRFRPGGELEFLGRLDHQVKIRGFRIELGEIEAVLGRHPAVRECVVLVREDVPGDRRLVAYVAGAEPDPAALRAFLAERLPGSMLPAAFAVLASFPRTANGKVDRKALPAPERRAEESIYVAPRDAVEELLAGIWREVLGLDRIGVHDSFFALGGHSLLATQVVTRVRETLGVEIPLRRLFEAPTLAQLAQSLRDQEPDLAHR